MANFSELRTRFMLMIALAIAAACSTTSLHAADGDGAEPARLSLTGRGEAHATPDIATLTIGVVTQGANARDAAQANNRAMNEAVNSLKAGGVEARDLQTSNYTIQPLYTSDPNRSTTPRIASYRATNTLIVQIRDLTKVGDLLERAVSLGANTVSGPNFSLADPEMKRNEARKAAMADALARAKLYAEGLGFRLGRVLMVREGETFARARALSAEVRAAALPAPPPIEAGESTISANVSVDWEILPLQ
ncbi:MAG: SIMPL domain-containing protein [Hyphomicrobiales bacterium]|nr:SIMPL domain-containing protein [Hyphomicrobiales bacterium]